MEACPGTACMSAAVVAPSTGACSRERGQGSRKHSNARQAVGDDDGADSRRLRREVMLGLG